MAGDCASDGSAVHGFPDGYGTSRFIIHLMVQCRAVSHLPFTTSMKTKVEHICTNIYV